MSEPQTVIALTLIIVCAGWLIAAGVAHFIKERRIERTKPPAPTWTPGKRVDFIPTQRPHRDAWSDDPDRTTRRGA